MDEERFDRVATQGRQMLSALFSPFVGAKGGQAVAYNAHFKGVEVVVFGYQYDEDGSTYTRPIAIAVDEELFDLLEVDEEAGRGKGEHAAPAREWTPPEGPEGDPVHRAGRC